MTATALAERYEGNFLEGLDLVKPFTLEIKEVIPAGKEKDARGKVIKDAIVTFTKAKKRLILNKTNWKLICAVHGKDESDWPGKKLTLQCRYLASFMGHDNVPCIRVIPPKGTPLPMSVHAWMGKPEPYTDAELEELRSKRGR